MGSGGYGGDSCFIKRLSKYYDLSTSDQLIIKALEERKEIYKPGETILKLGAETSHIYLVYEGWIKYHTLFNNGETCVSDIKLPGDMVGLFSFTSRLSITNITAIDTATLCPLPIERLKVIFKESPSLAVIFFSMMSRENSFLLERLKGVGKIEAVQQVAYFILLIALRIGDINRIEDNRFYWPIDQSTFGDLLGLSSVHINRCLIELKNKKLIEYSRNAMKILNVEKLEELSEFNKLVKRIDYRAERMMDAVTND